jgi:protein-S-isoprenylcysteine O-methyltransferase Ste14
MRGTPVLPPTYLLASLLVMVALHFLLPAAYIILMPWNILGIVPLACGLVINAIADSAFHRVKTTVKPFEGPTTLITSGVYRISRHPMYLGFVLILIGVAAILGSLTPWGVIPIFAVLMDRVFIVVEERTLEEKFGRAWSEYKQEVRRWV